MSTQVELREASPGKLVLRGYASVSERWYPVGRRFEERMKRGAWRRMLGANPDTVLLEDHDGLGLARTKTPSGKPSLILDETDYGLRCEAFLDATSPRVQDLRATADNCGLQMSVGMTVQDDEWNAAGDRREVKAATTHKGDVTVCNFGANNAASAVISERSGEVGEVERRELRGSRERRMCPALDGFDLRADPGSSLTVARRSPVPIVRSYVEVERAMKAKTEAREGGTEDEGPRYTDKQIQRLGEEGKALKKKSGRGFHFPIVDGRDLNDAVRAWGRAVPSERQAVKNWIIRRAVLLRLTGRLPEAWQAKVRN